MDNRFKLLISILIPFIASAIGGFFTSTSVSDWYLELVKPSFNPPSWIFGPVWTVLFFLMGISLFLIWKDKHDWKAFFIFGLQLFLNVLWSAFFFGLQNITLALIEIFILWIAILFTIISFYRINKTAAYLLLPYIIWVSFAIILNFNIYLLN